ncbi:MAG: hypothetical protein LBT91_01225 [Bifidobacteriaceae bacterium]|jgi:hypothetical protein|nr:hypothetical protein [Bifidobacteriaceae bacterium]
MKKCFKCLLVIAFIVAISSCSSQATEPKQHRILDKSTYGTALGSDFDGPYADEIAGYVRSNKSDYLYNVLKDSKISDAEFQETQNNFKQCIKNYGYNVKFGGADVLGTYTIIIPGDFEYGSSVSVPASAVDAQNNCDGNTANSDKKRVDYSSIASLYYKMLWNPQKKDLLNESALCLVKLGYEQPGYTGAEFKAQFGGPDGAIAAGGDFGNENDTPGQRDERQYENKAEKIDVRLPSRVYNVCALNPESVLGNK